MWSTWAQTLLHFLPLVTAVEPLKVAIIGAGAGGSSAAFWLSLAQERSGAVHGRKVGVTVYEKDNRVGGRSTTIYPYNDQSYAPIELGASIFVDANRNLIRAVSEFGFETVSFDGAVPGEGIWDGSRFLFRSTNDPETDGARFGERYGDGPMVSGELVGKFTTSFVKSYIPGLLRFNDTKSYASALDYTTLPTVFLSEYFTSNGVNQNWTNDFVWGSSRFNYGQDANAINGVAGLASLSAGSAYSVKTGNWRVYEQFLKRSGAKLLLNTEVTAITKVAGSKRKYLVTAKHEKGGVYDAVVVAAPFSLSNIKLNHLPQPSTFPKVDYVHLHVTLFTTTTTSLRPGYFKADPLDGPLPGTVLTTAASGIQPEFNSIRYQASIQKNGTTEYVVKIFSRTRVSDNLLDKLFGRKSIGWIYRKEWDAYPYYPKRTEFPPTKIDEGLYYVNSMEGLISTMETETISSRNVVDLLSTDLLGAGLCGPSGAVGLVTEGYVVGWDC